MMDFSEQAAECERRAMRYRTEAVDTTNPILRDLIFDRGTLSSSLHPDAIVILQRRTELVLSRSPSEKACAAESRAGEEIGPWRLTVGPPMTLGNMRASLGLRRLLVSCLDPECRPRSTD